MLTSGKLRVIYKLDVTFHDVKNMEYQYKSCDNSFDWQLEHETLFDTVQITQEKKDDMKRRLFALAKIKANLNSFV